jgi:hypothetical protein
MLGCRGNGDRSGHARDRSDGDLLKADEDLLRKGREKGRELLLGPATPPSLAVARRAELQEQGRGGGGAPVWLLPEGGETTVVTSPI